MVAQHLNKKGVKFGKKKIGKKDGLMSNFPRFMTVNLGV
jgi:hypothetical protein